MPVIPDKQARRVAIPIGPIVDMLARKGLVVNPILREVRGDVRQGVVLLHLDTDLPPGVTAQPFDLKVDWAEFFQSV
jgi:hypothetical protein